MVRMVASRAQNSFRGNLASGPVVSRRSPSRTYQPPSGSLVAVPRCTDGPRDHSGTGVAPPVGKNQAKAGKCYRLTIGNPSSVSFVADPRKSAGRR
jgi:hypothetical protein